MATEPVVLFEERSNGVGVITLNRPKSLNSLNQDVFEELLALCKRLSARNSTVKVVVLNAAGDRAFSAGNDVKGGQFTARGDPRLQVNTIEALYNLPQPLLVAVNGACYTGALELIMPADFIIASEKAVFCDTHSTLGLVPTWGLSVRLPRRVGLANAKLISFTGRKFSASESKELGLVDLVVKHEELMTKVLAMAEEIADKSAESIQKQKRMMNHAYMASGREALSWTDEVHGFHPGMLKLVLFIINKI